MSTKSCIVCFSRKRWVGPFPQATPGRSAYHVVRIITSAALDAWGTHGYGYCSGVYTSLGMIT
jgi:hypothetical protein